MRRAPRGLVLVAAAALLIVGVPRFAHAQTPGPTAVTRFDLSTLVGDWYEALSSERWALRRCVADTRHRFVVDGARALRVFSACTTARGAEHRRGRLEGTRSGDGRLALRYAPVALAWIPAAWDDFWILAQDLESGWLLVGDRRGQSAVILSRLVAPDEASMARALAAARSQGYDVNRLTGVAHPFGASGLLPGR